MEAHKKGLPMRKIAKECSVSLSSVSRIVKEKNLQKGREETGETLLKQEKQKKIEELERKIADLERKYPFPSN